MSNKINKNRSQPVEIINNNNQVLNLDNILATQPEIGPSIPDGGYGWIVFGATLFFQIILPNLISSFGIFLAFAKLKNFTTDPVNPSLWDDNFFYVPLLFMISRTVSEPLSRLLISKSTWPRLVGTAGNCLTCAGLLFAWIGLTHNNNAALFILSGIITGLGASVQLVQCEILLAQYFRTKLAILQQISKMVAALGFILAPVLLGHNILSTNLFNVILWYQAIILQGLVVNILFRKPLYLKSKQKPYDFVAANPDDEEDIFSKHSRELQIRRQTSSDTHVSKIEFDQASPGTSGVDASKNWVKFDDTEEEIKYDKLNEWETFEEDEDDVQTQPKHEQMKNSRETNEISLADEIKEIKIIPSPLFTDTPVNNNNTYAYDDEEITAESNNTNVFATEIIDNELSRIRAGSMWSPLKELTFYKSLFMVTTNVFSVFIFFATFPSYLFVEVEIISLKHMSTLIGALSFCSLTFLVFSYCLKVNKKWRPFCLWILCWMGCVGYFMISDYASEKVLLAGAILIIISIDTLNHVCKSITGITIKGETSQEYNLLCILSGLSLLVFLMIDMSYKSGFRMLAILHFFVGALWFSNFAYKRIRANIA